MKTPLECGFPSAVKDGLDGFGGLDVAKSVATDVDMRALQLRTARLAVDDLGLRCTRAGAPTALPAVLETRYIHGYRPANWVSEGLRELVRHRIDLMMP